MEHFQVWVANCLHHSYLEESFFLFSPLEIKGMSTEHLDGSDSYRENYMTKCLPGRLEKNTFRH